MLKTFILIVYAVLFVFGAIHTACIIIDYMKNGGYEYCYNLLRKIAFIATMSVVMLLWPFVFIGLCIYWITKKVNSFI